MTSCTGGEGGGTDIHGIEDSSIYRDGQGHNNDRRDDCAPCGPRRGRANPLSIKGVEKSVFDVRWRMPGRVGVSECFQRTANHLIGIHIDPRYHHQFFR